MASCLPPTQVTISQDGSRGERKKEQHAHCVILIRILALFALIFMVVSLFSPFSLSDRCVIPRPLRSFLFQRLFSSDAHEAFDVLSPRVNRGSGSGSGSGSGTEVHFYQVLPLLPEAATLFLQVVFHPPFCSPLNHFIRVFFFLHSAASLLDNGFYKVASFELRLIWLTGNQSRAVKVERRCSVLVFQRKMETTVNMTRCAFWCLALKKGGGFSAGISVRVHPLSEAICVTRGQTHFDEMSD